MPYDSIMMVIHPFVRHKRDCVGAITLGKDMVFRDYAQGAYRLRGIGKGQKLRILIIPETCQWWINCSQAIQCFVQSFPFAS